MKVLFELQGDSSTVMAFAVGEPTVREIRAKFPLAGDWHFRVRDGGGCWRDLVDPDETLAGPVRLRALPLALPAPSAPAAFQAEDWIVEEGASWEHEAAFRAAPVAAAAAAATATTATTAAPTAPTSMDEKFAKLGSSMFSAFKSVVKNVS